MNLPSFLATSQIHYGNCRNDRPAIGRERGPDLLRGLNELSATPPPRRAPGPRQAGDVRRRDVDGPGPFDHHIRLLDHRVVVAVRSDLRSACVMGPKQMGGRFVESAPSRAFRGDRTSGGSWSDGSRSTTSRRRPVVVGCRAPEIHARPQPTGRCAAGHGRARRRAVGVLRGLDGHGAGGAHRAAPGILDRHAAGRSRRRHGRAVRRGGCAVALHAGTHGLLRAMSV